MLSKYLDNIGTYSWYTYIKSIYYDTELYDKIENCNNMNEVYLIKPLIKRLVEEKYKNTIVNKINSYDETNKLCLYKNLKLSLDQEFYLSSHDLSIRRCFTKLRLSDHNLEIEKGRYFKTPRDERLCKTCHVIENEEHFLLHCNLNKQKRLELFDKLGWKIETINMYSLLNPVSIEHVKLIGSFLKQSFELRAKED